MSTRLESALHKYPNHADGIRLLAERDPSGNLKYLDWGARVLASGQALAREVGDVTELYHRFRGQFYARRGRQAERVHPDIYAYRPHELAHLRDILRRFKRRTDRKRRERERLYRIEGSVEADVVYDSPDLVVRHIKNKQASVHYGHGTKWCIAMLREGYFQDYESNNATFFFFERKAPVGDEFDKIALMVQRDDLRNVTHAEAYSTLDQRCDMMTLAKVHGPRVFDIFREVYERSMIYPGSALLQIMAGTASVEQIEAARATIAAGTWEPRAALDVVVGICCNDATPQSMLEDLALGVLPGGRLHRVLVPTRRYRWRATELVRTILAALVIHPNISVQMRAEITKALRRRHVVVESIHRTKQDGRAGVYYTTREGYGCSNGRRQRGARRSFRRRRSRWTQSVTEVRKAAARHDRWAARLRKKARALQRKQMNKKKRRVSSKKA